MLRASDRGFTLIEVLVALTLGALLVLMAHAALGGALDFAGRLEARRAEHDATAQARAFLGRAFGNLDLMVPGSSGFQGGPDRVAFTTRLGEGGGALRPVTLQLAVTEGRLIALRSERATPLIEARAVAFDYLLAYGATSTWVREWHSPVSAPLAVRLRVLRPDGVVDTLLLVIGPRG